MDSMRTLNRSLPRSPRRRRANKSVDELIQSFKTAALTVTKLYKTAVSDQATQRAAGYQDALDDLLLFLDREDLGLEDGEGWKVRQWATEHLDDTQTPPPPNESDDDRGECDNRAQSDSPKLHRRSDLEQVAERPHSAQAATAPIVRDDDPEQQGSASPPAACAGLTTSPGIFTFRSEYPYPQAMETETNGFARLTANPSNTPDQAQFTSNNPALRVEVLPRGPKPRRNSHQGSRHNVRDSRTLRTLGAGAGAKRRVPMAEWFELGDFGESKDGFGSINKKGRFA